MSKSVPFRFCVCVFAFAFSPFTFLCGALCRIWGIGLKAEDARAMAPTEWPGTNLLGECMMRVRARLQAVEGAEQRAQYLGSD